MNPRTLHTILISILCIFTINISHAQVSQGFENLSTALNCGNNSCLYFDSKPAGVRHLLSDNNNIPVTADGTGEILGFTTEFLPSRTGASGTDGLGEGDVFGVGGPNQIDAELGVDASEGNQAFLMQDTDGQVSMYFDHVDLNGTVSPVLRLDYMLSETTWERSSGQNDRFYVRVDIDQCASATTITLIDTDGGGSGGNSGGDIDALEIEGAWNTLSADLAEFKDCRARLIIEFDSNSAAEVLGIDKIEFTEGQRADDNSYSSIEVPQLIGSTQEEAISAILEAGLTLGEIDSIPSLEWAAGLVVQQDPMAGSSSEAGTAVSLSVSTGVQDSTPPEIVCPDDIVLGVDASVCGTRVSFEVVAYDDSGNVSIETTIPSGSFFALGTTEVIAEATDEAGNTSRCSFQVIIKDRTNGVLEIKGFVLIDAHKDHEIMELTDGMRIDPGMLNTDSLNIRAVGTDDIKSVGFELRGTREIHRKENLPPYALFGDYEGNYVGHQFQPGAYKLTATPYPANNLNGNPGPSATVRFEIVFSTVEGDTDSPPAVVEDSIVISEDNSGGNAIKQVVLVDALNNNDIMRLEDGWIIDLLTLTKTKFNIRADATRDVQSVAFELSGPVHVRRTENEVPFALFGDRKGDYYAGNLPLGNYELTIRPFSEKYLNGLAGDPLTIRFTVVEGNGGGLLLKLYPNQTRTAIRVDFGNDWNTADNYSLQIHDIQGRMIRNYSSSELWGQNPFNISTQSIPAGIYFMTVEDTSGWVERKAFVVSK